MTRHSTSLQRAQLPATIVALTVMALGVGVLVASMGSDEPATSHGQTARFEAWKARVDVSETPHVETTPSVEAASEADAATRAEVSRAASDAGDAHASVVTERAHEVVRAASGEAVAQAPKVGRVGRKRAKKGKTLRPATLIIVTNFVIADVTVNGLAYPEYHAPGEPRGMLLPAGGPYTIKVSYGDKQKIYTLALRPYETRYLMVELSGYTGKLKVVNAKPTSRTPPKQKTSKNGQGRVTVYAKPRGTIVVDEKDSKKRTPNSVMVPPGRHEIQVRYKNNKLSEKKIVRTRKGSQIKLFFRQR